MKHLLLWCDNCAKQNKNRMIIFVIVFLALHEVFETIEYNFLISGHSFMACLLFIIYNLFITLPSSKRKAYYEGNGAK